MQWLEQKTAAATGTLSCGWSAAPCCGRSSRRCGASCRSLGGCAHGRWAAFARRRPTASRGVGTGACSGGIAPQRRGRCHEADGCRHVIAIGKVQAGDWIDPTDEPAAWWCRLYDPAGQCVGDGDARTAGEAMALAWIAARAPDALHRGRVEIGEVPYEVPDGWRFEVTPAP